MPSTIHFPDSYEASGVPETTLAAGITSGALSLTVTTLPAGVDPANGWNVNWEFSVKIENERIHILSIGGGGNLVWTIAADGRGYGHTTPASHATNADVFYDVLRDDFERAMRGTSAAQIFMASNFM